MPVSRTLTNPVLVLALSNLDFQIQLSILNLKNLVSRCETQMGRNLGHLFENLIFSRFGVLRSFSIFSIEKKFSKNVKDTYSWSASHSLSDRLKKNANFFFHFNCALCASYVMNIWRYQMAFLSQIQCRIANFYQSTNYLEGEGDGWNCGYFISTCLFRPKFR